MSIPRNLGNFADNVNANGKVEVTGINATGTPSASTVLYGNGTWAAAGGGGSPAGSNTQIQYNNSGAFGASANLTFDGNTLSSSTATASGVSLNTSTAGKANLVLKSAGTQKAIIGLSGAILGTSATDVGLFAETGGAIKLYANGAVTNSGTFNQYGFGIGAAVPSSGQGITFPAAQDASSNANTLDDYEEGTWTPAIAGGVTSPVLTVNYGSYIKIGRQVTVYCLFTLSGTTNGAQFKVSGLPFALSTNGNYYPPGGATTYQQLSTTAAYPWASASATTVDFYQTATTGPSSFTLASSPSGGYFGFFFTYLSA